MAKPAQCHADRPNVARGMCVTCYNVWRRRRNPEVAERYRAYMRNYFHKWKVVRFEKWKAGKRQGTLKRYGLTLDDYEKLYKSQRGRCAICARSHRKAHGLRGESFHVDHDHRTGQVRGLLCRRCNAALGVFTTTTLLRSALRYLGR